MRFLSIFIFCFSVLTLPTHAAVVDTTKLDQVFNEKNNWKKKKRFKSVEYHCMSSKCKDKLAIKVGTTYIRGMSRDTQAVIRGSMPTHSLDRYFVHNFKNKLNNFKSKTQVRGGKIYLNFSGRHKNGTYLFGISRIEKNTLLMSLVGSPSSLGAARAAAEKALKNAIFKRVN